MKALRFFNLAVLSVLIGTASLVYAQDEKQEDRPARPEETKQDEARPPKQEEVKPSKQDEAKPEKQEKQDMKRDQQRGQPAGKGGKIPDDKFRAHFGRSHTFTAKTVIVQGRPQFQYGGYSFQLVDVWPVGWAYTDECYIDYIDGEYFLFDLLHPGVRIAVFVVL